MDVILFNTFSHVIIMMRKVDPHAELGVGIIITECFIKVIDGHRDSEKAYSDKKTFLKIIKHCFL